MGPGEEAGSGHYEVLGVSPTASTAEIRAAYVALARRHHPDRRSGDSAADRSASAERMARINAAWTVLSNPHRRADYDARRAGAHGVHHGAHVRGGDAPFRPFETGEDEIDPRLLDDTPTGAPTLHRALTFVPAGLGAAGVVVTGTGMLLRFGALLGFGVLLIVASGLAFLLLPLVALFKASRADPDP